MSDTGSQTVFIVEVERPKRLRAAIRRMKRIWVTPVKKVKEEMKKLMIAAAAAAMIGGAYADVCDDEGDVAPSGCMVYDLKISAKTLVPKKGKCKSGAVSDCKDGCNVVYYLDNGNRTFKGYIWFCDTMCWDSNETDSNLVLWDAKTKAPVVPVNYGKITKNGKEITKYYYTSINDGFYGWTFLGRYGKKSSKIAASWWVATTPISINAAGLNGSGFKDKEACTLSLKSISGAFAGSVTPELKISKTGITGSNGRRVCIDVMTNGMYAELCDCVQDLCDLYQTATTVPATGTWSLKYNKKLSTGSTPMYKIVPKYALWDEDAYGGTFEDVYEDFIEYYEPEDAQ